MSEHQINMKVVEEETNRNLKVNLTEVNKNKLCDKSYDKMSRLLFKDNDESRGKTVVEFKREDYKDISAMNRYLQNTDIFKQNFELISYIASGSKGIVYKSRPLKNEGPKKLALKFIFHEKGDELRLRKKLEEVRKKRDEETKEKINEIKTKISEINLLKTIRHKNICSTYGYYSTVQHTCIFLECADFGDMASFRKKFIETQTVSESLLCFFTKQILDGLEYLKALNILHYDLKPMNILVNEKMELKITDFSISQCYSEQIKNGKNIQLKYGGTPGYMSLEVLKSMEIDCFEAEKIDLYSLGVMLYYFATNEFPYGISLKERPTREEQIKCMEENKLQFNKLSNYSSSFIDLLYNLLQKDISKRINISEMKQYHWVKSSQILYETKEKVVDLQKFLVILETNNVLDFNSAVGIM